MYSFEFLEKRFKHKPGYPFAVDLIIFTVINKDGRQNEGNFSSLNMK